MFIQLRAGECKPQLSPSTVMVQAHMQVHGLQWPLRGARNLVLRFLSGVCALDPDVLFCPMRDLTPEISPATC